MSRIGKRPIPLPDKVSITIAGQTVNVKGPKGELSRSLVPEVSIEQEDSATLLVKRRNESRLARQRHGLSRTLVANMVEGVSQGFQKRLEIQGVGYRAQMQGTKLVLSMGYSHPVTIDPPQGIQIAVENNTNVGNIAASIRAVRPPEPYKGKGIRYSGEFVRRKVGKAGKK
jgi:large subunit ribosomal protein L6